jgi:hypothetical protein
MCLNDLRGHDHGKQTSDQEPQQKRGSHLRGHDPGINQDIDDNRHGYQPLLD